MVPPKIRCIMSKFTVHTKTQLPSNYFQTSLTNITLQGTPSGYFDVSRLVILFGNLQNTALKMSCSCNISPK